MCSGRGSNPHAQSAMALNHACIPIPPPERLPKILTLNNLKLKKFVIIF